MFVPAHINPSVILILVVEKDNTLIRTDLANFDLQFKLILKPRPSNRDVSTQRITTLLGATCCAHLATLLRRFAKC